MAIGDVAFNMNDPKALRTLGPGHYGSCGSRLSMELHPPWYNSSTKAEPVKHFVRTKSITYVPLPPVHSLRCDCDQSGLFPDVKKEPYVSFV